MNQSIKFCLIMLVNITFGHCTLNPYCINCKGDGGISSETAIDKGEDYIGDGEELIDIPCIPGAEEICNGRDDNCNGEIDEGFDLNTDINNCGSCGNRCALPHAFNECVEGSCLIKQCDIGYYDLDGIKENGCEYACLPRPTITNEYCMGEDCCDGIDNDCDGLIDEDANLLDDPNNCGSCGNRCSLPNATSICQNGECVIIACRENYFDRDRNMENGCEEFCIPIQTRHSQYCIGEDCCDGIDNDCDGLIDEDANLLDDPNNCGSCGNRCSLPNAISDCQNGRCVVRLCLSGYYDLDPNIPGCEYHCEYQGNEECNGRDDDCNGLIDDNVTPPRGYCGTMGVCSNITPVCMGTQGWRCNYPQSYEAEEHSCDGLDNDCDGLIDEGFNVGQRCSVGQGECMRVGQYICNNLGNGTVCNATPGQPQPELCDGLDNDCDGVVDNNITLSNMNLIHITGVDSDIDGDGFVSGNELNRDFYIFKYEASRPDATSQSQGEITGYACSNPNVLPWTVVTWNEARDACCGLNSDGQCHYQNITTSQGQIRAPQGWNLCLAGDWEVACQQSGFSSNPPEANGLPYLYPYGDIYNPNYCNGNDYNPSCPGGGDDCLLPTGSLQNCIGTSYRIYDMSGNAYEWTHTGYNIGGTMYYEYRGGSYKNPPLGLTCQFDFNIGRDSPNFVLENLGFRCCYYP